MYINANYVPPLVFIMNHELICVVCVDIDVYIDIYNELSQIM